MIYLFKQLIRKSFNQIGLDIVRISKSPKHTFLGLRNLPIRSIIDVGANKGQFAKTISRVFPEANIYCFEPLPTPFRELSKWAERQNERVSVFNIAIGDRIGTVEMFNHLNHNPSSSLLKSTKICEGLYPLTKKQIPISVKLTTLDEVMCKLSRAVAPDILIKIDVQGYEDRVIRGGAEAFRRARACILEVCLDKLYENQANFIDILLLLYDLGFHYTGNLEQIYADDGHVIFIDTAFTK